MLALIASFLTMKNARIIRNYYDEYLNVCRSVSPGREFYDLHKLVHSNLMENNCGIPFGTCLIDYSARRYAYLSDHCNEIISYSKDEYMTGGLDYHARIFHPEDRVVFNELVFKDILEYWKTIPSKEISRYRFSFTHRYFRRDGSISQLLQQGTYLEPQSGGVPVLNMLIFSDIGDFKSDQNLVLTISFLVEGAGYVKIFSKSYTNNRNSILSSREAEVLRLSLKGLSSKMIADKLFISIQTVKNHKRNMMEKTSAKNIAELISLSLKNNWL